jgi:hypothetical protein
MPDRPESIPPPPWIEADSIRETMLIYLDAPEDREAVRQFGRVLYDLALAASIMPRDESTTRAEMRAVAVELRYLQGFLATIRRSVEEFALDDSDERLARYAGRLAHRVGDMAAAVEVRL